MASGGKHINGYVKDYVVFDLETTGISVMHDEVIEISAVKVADGKVIDEFTTLVNPGMSIPDEASSVNGIYDNMVADAPNFETALADFLQFIGNSILVGHNIASFDMKFITRDADKYWGLKIKNNYVDTLRLARAYLPQLGKYKLVDLASHYGISSDGAHRALNDCRMNQKVFEKLAKDIANPSEEALKVPKCPKCGSVLKIRNGMYGEFWGCTAYPDCRFTKNVKA